MQNIFTHIHPATVHFPIALLLLAAGAGLLYLHWRRHAVLRVLTWWPLLLGWLGNGVAILTGLLAQSGLPPQAPYRGTLNWHITSGLALWAVAGLLLYRWWLHGKMAKRPPLRKTQSLPTIELLDEPHARAWLTATLLLLIALIFASGWNGGQLVYTWGVNVAQQLD